MTIRALLVHTALQNYTFTRNLISLNFYNLPKLSCGFKHDKKISQNRWHRPVDKRIFSIVGFTRIAVNFKFHSWFANFKLT